MKPKIFAALLLLSALAWSVPASANNGTQSFDIPYEEVTPTIDCIGEAVHMFVTASVVTHQFVTASGVSHLVDNWTLSGYAIGVTSGRTWLVQAATSPLIENSRSPGSTFTLTFNARHTAVDGGPDFLIHNRLKLVFNANGEWVVFNSSYLEGKKSYSKCVGN